MSEAEATAAHRPTDRRLLAIFCRVAAMACVAGLYATVRWADQRGVPVFEIVLFRSVFALIPIGGFMLARKDPSLFRTKRPLGHLVRSGIGLTSMVCSFAALKFIPLTESTAFGFTVPLFMTTLAVFVLHERVGFHRVGALAMGFAGVLVMLRPEPGHMNWMGASLALAGAASSAGAMVAIRQIGATERASTIAFYFTLAGIAVGLVGLIGGWVAPDPTTLGVLILGGLIGGFTQLLLSQAMTLAPVSVVAPFDYTQLLWATLLSLAVWGEAPTLTTLLGAGIVAASGLYITYREQRIAAGALPRRGLARRA
jgi:drug/metabolite transporter (DMT)-like permease